MRTPNEAVKVALVPIFLFSVAVASACSGSDEETSSPMGLSDPIEVSLESITIDDALYAVLDIALQDEYQARATYAAAIQAYGEIRPFSQIVKAEERHVSAVAHLFDKRSTPVPDWDATGNPVPADFSVLELAEACAISYQAEIDNVTIYTDLIASGVPADVEAVFLTLKAASETRHMPAFSRCM